MIDITFKEISTEDFCKIALALGGNSNEPVMIEGVELKEHVSPGVEYGETSGLEGEGAVEVATGEALTIKELISEIVTDEAAKKPATTATEADTSTVSLGLDSVSVNKAEEKPVVAPPAETAELDLKRTPWDERIHSKNKSKNQDGSWRYKQGVDRQVLVPQVEAEIRGTAAPSDEVPPEQVAAAKSLFAAGKPAVTPPAETNKPVVTPPEATTQEPAAVSFIELISLVTAGINEGTITAEKSESVLVEMGIGFHEMSIDQKLIPTYMQAVGL